MAIEYKCSACGAEGCKLWRQYQTFLDRISLLCVNCAAEDQGIVIESINNDGVTMISGNPLPASDQIGWLVPAVLTSDGETFWGYCSVPEDCVKWWCGLPNYPNMQDQQPAESER